MRRRWSWTAAPRPALLIPKAVASTTQNPAVAACTVVAIAGVVLNIQASRLPLSSHTSSSCHRTNSPTVCSVGNLDSCSLPAKPLSSPSRRYNSPESSKLSTALGRGVYHYPPVYQGHCVYARTECPNIPLDNVVNAVRTRKDRPYAFKAWPLM